MDPGSASSTTSQISFEIVQTINLNIEHSSIAYLREHNFLSISFVEMIQEVEEVLIRRKALTILY